MITKFLTRNVPFNNKQTFAKVILATLFLLIAQNNGVAQEVSLDRIAAVVNNDVVMFSEVRQVANRIVRKTPDASKLTNKQLIKEALDHLIMTRLQIQKAKQLGIKIDDNDVNNALLSIAKQNNLNLEQFRVALKREGMNYNQFRESIREKIQLDVLSKRQKSSSSKITEDEVDDLIKSESYRLNKEVQYHLQDILIPAPNGISVSQFNASHIKANKLRTQLLGKAEFLNQKVLTKYQAKGKGLGWKSSSQLSPAYMRTLSLMQPGEISPIVRDPQGFHIFKLIEQKGGKRQITQKAHVRHILIAADIPQARIKLLQLRQKILAGNDFAKLAKSHSADKGSATKGGDLGTVDPSVFVPPFANAVKSLPLNSLSQPIQTKFGWHLIQVLSRSNSDQTRDSLKAQAQALLSNQKQSDKYKHWLKDLRANAYIEYRL